MLGRGLAWEFVNLCQFLLKNSLFSIPKLKTQKAGGNMWETTGKIGTGPTPVSERMYRTIPRTHAKVKPENAKKLTERIPVSHTLNLLRNGSILKGLHNLHPKREKSNFSLEITETRETPLFRATGKREHEVGRGRKALANRPKTPIFGFPRK